MAPPPAADRPVASWSLIGGGPSPARRFSSVESGRPEELADKTHDHPESPIPPLVIPILAIFFVLVALTAGCWICSKWRRRRKKNKARKVKKQKDIASASSPVQEMEELDVGECAKMMDSHRDMMDSHRDADVASRAPSSPTPGSVETTSTLIDARPSTARPTTAGISSLTSSSSYRPRAHALAPSWVIHHARVRFQRLGMRGFGHLHEEGVEGAPLKDVLTEERWREWHGSGLLSMSPGLADGDNDGFGIGYPGNDLGSHKVAGGEAGDLARARAHTGRQHAREEESENVADVRHTFEGKREVGKWERHRGFGGDAACKYGSAHHHMHADGFQGLQRGMSRMWGSFSTKMLNVFKDSQLDEEEDLESGTLAASEPPSRPTSPLPWRHAKSGEEGHKQEYRELSRTRVDHRVSDATTLFSDLLTPKDKMFVQEDKLEAETKPEPWSDEVRASLSKPPRRSSGAYIHSSKAPSGRLAQSDSNTAKRVSQSPISARDAMAKLHPTQVSRSPSRPRPHLSAKPPRSSSDEELKRSFEMYSLQQTPSARAAPWGHQHPQSRHPSGGRSIDFETMVKKTQTALDELVSILQPDHRRRRGARSPSDEGGSSTSITDSSADDEYPSDDHAGWSLLHSRSTSTILHVVDMRPLEAVTHAAAAEASSKAGDEGSMSFFDVDLSSGNDCQEHLSDASFGRVSTQSSEWIDVPIDVRRRRESGAVPPSSGTSSSGISRLVRRSAIADHRRSSRQESRYFRLSDGSVEDSSSAFTNGITRARPVEVLEDIATAPGNASDVTSPGRACEGSKGVTVMIENDGDGVAHDEASSVGSYPRVQESRRREGSFSAVMQKSSGVRSRTEGEELTQGDVDDLEAGGSEDGRLPSSVVDVLLAVSVGNAPTETGKTSVGGHMRQAEEKGTGAGMDATIIPSLDVGSIPEAPNAYSNCTEKSNDGEETPVFVPSPELQRAALREEVSPSTDSASPPPLPPKEFAKSHDLAATAVEGAAPASLPSVQGSSHEVNNRGRVVSAGKMHKSVKMMIADFEAGAKAAASPRSSSPPLQISPTFSPRNHPLALGPVIRAVHSPADIRSSSALPLSPQNHPHLFFANAVPLTGLVRVDANGSGGKPTPVRLEGFAQAVAPTAGITSMLAGAEAGRPSGRESGAPSTDFRSTTLGTPPLGPSTEVLGRSTSCSSGGVISSTHRTSIVSTDPLEPRQSRASGVEEDGKQPSAPPASGHKVASGDSADIPLARNASEDAFGDVVVSFGSLASDGALAAFLSPNRML